MKTYKIFNTTDDADPIDSVKVVVYSDGKPGREKIFISHDGLQECVSRAETWIRLDAKGQDSNLLGEYDGQGRRM